MKYYSLQFGFRADPVVIAVDHDPDNDGVDVPDEHFRFEELARLEGGNCMTKPSDFVDFLYGYFAISSEVLLSSKLGVCRDCRLAKWTLTPTGRIRKNIPGRCGYELRKTFKLPVSVPEEPYVRTTAIWPDEDRPCPCFEPKPSTQLENAK